MTDPTLVVDGATRSRSVDLRVMGCAARVVVVGGAAGLLDDAARRLADLEARWSRFRPDSELTRLSGGRPTVVSAETYLLVERAVDGWWLTDGAFDATVLDALERAGYSHSFDELSEPTGEGGSSAPAVGCADVRLDPIVSAVELPLGVRIDPGGIGKGLAGDIVVGELLAQGAAGALVDLGGDVRVAGESIRGGPWLVAIEDPGSSRPLTTISLHDGAVATSSRAHRRWTQVDGSTAHHLVDPATGECARSGALAATAVAADGWQAEVYAKAAFLAGPVHGAELLRAAGLVGLIVGDDGSVHDCGIAA